MNRPANLSACECVTRFLRVYMWVYVGVYGCMWVYVRNEISGAWHGGNIVRLQRRLRRCMWVYLGESECVWVYVGVCGCMWVYHVRCLTWTEYCPITTKIDTPTYTHIHQHTPTYTQIHPDTPTYTHIQPSRGSLFAESRGSLFVYVVAFVSLLEWYCWRWSWALKSEHIH